MDSKAKPLDEVTPETLAVIAAAATEFLGYRVKIRSVRKVPTRSAVDRWARQGRVTVQTSHNLTPRGR